MSKSLARNAIYNVIYKALSVLFPLITVTYASHKLLAFGIGQVSYAQSVVAYFVIFASLGIPYYGVREIAKSNSQLEENVTFSNIFLLNALTTTIASVAYYVFILFSPVLRQQLVLFSVVGVWLLLNFFNVDWYYQGKEEYGYIALRSLCVKIIFTILLFLTIKGPHDYIKYAFIYYLAIAGNYLFNFVHLRKYVHFDFSRIEILKHLKSCLIFFSGVVSIELYMQIGITLLGTYYDKEYVGYYSNMNHVMRVLSNTLMALGAVILPRISKYYADGRIEEIRELTSRLICLLAFISLPCSVMLGILSKHFVPIFFGYSFIPAISTLSILSILVFILTLIGGVTTPILLSTNRENMYLKSSFFSLILNIILIAVLMPKFFHNGVAIASVLTEGFMLIISIIYISSFIKFKYVFRNLGRIMFMCMILVSCIALFERLFAYNSLKMIIIEIVLGVITYFCLALLFKDQSLKFIIKEVLKIKKIY